MRLFFGKKKESAPTAPQTDIPTAIMKSNEALDVLEKREAHIQRKMDSETELAKQKMRAGDKRSALMALKRRELLAKQMENVNNQRLTLENEKINLESVQSQQIALEALKSGVDAHRAAAKTVDINQVDKIMDDLQELKDMRDEVDQIFSQQVTTTDDADLMAELERMQEEELDTQLVNAATVPVSAKTTTVPTVAPSVPAQAAATKNSDEDQLAALQAFLA